MADLIQVSSIALRDKANILISAANNIKMLTEDIKNEISKMRPAWEGEAAEKFVVKFNGLNNNFDGKYNTINNYSKYLNNAADEFDKTSGEIESQEDGLIS